MTHEPSQYVQTEVTDTRVNRLWHNVSGRLAPRSAFSWRWLVLGGALAGAAGASYFVLKSPSSPVAASAVLADAQLETKGDELAVSLRDGSRVTLAAHSALKVGGDQASSVSLSLARGEVVCDVTHREGRKFAVVAGDVVVRVVGTKFSVKTDGGSSPRVEVAVLRGLVEIESRRRPGVVARVAAGQGWLQDVSAAVPPPPALVEAAPSAVLEPEPSASLSAAPVGPSARELFEKAGESRRAGDASAAAHAYAELLRLHASDGRASLAAFELGRLKMDRLGDPAGAISALERAVAMNIGPSFREDALARLVSVYASQGNSAACIRARDRYLSSYPAGVHGSAVKSRCGSR
jgi:transmembrane sensor